MVDGPAGPSRSAGRPLRIAFFGTPQFAVPTLSRLLESRHPVCGVVTQPDRPRGRGQRVQSPPVKALALEHGLPVFQPERLREPDVERTLRAWAPDLGVVVAYGQLIPETLLAVPPLGMINVHASLLPKYRGAAPVHRAVIDGEPETGVTIMRVVKALDAGDTLARVRRPIGPDETSDAVERDLADLGAALLVDTVDRMSTSPLEAEPQDAGAATYAHRLTKEEGLIDWTRSAAAVHNRVRGLHPWPHAYTYLDGERLILLTTQVEAARGADEAEPGSVVAISHEAIGVATGDGGRIAIRTIQPEGRRAMPVRDFLAGRPLAPGARFTREPASGP